MPNKTKIGNILVDGGVVYKIHKIRVEQIKDRMEKVIYYKPLYTNISNVTLECSIPESSLEFSNLKEPRSKSEIGNFLNYLSSKVFKKEDIDFENIGTLVNQNDIFKTAYIIKYFWKEHSLDATSLTKTKLNQLNLAIEKITEEVSHVMGTNLKNGKKLIIKELNKYSKNKSWKLD